MRKVNILIFVTGVQLVGLYCILVGIIGEKKLIDKEITPIPYKIYNHSNGGDYTSTVNKIVIVVIDALRVDFLFRNKMPFIASKLDESKGCIFVTRVKAPTVTLPRIKALVSGDISTYWDFINNFQSSVMTQDNFLWQAQSNSKTLVFYGDDTWLKLFPNEFTRKEGVSSFFVTDFTEVDNNVTKNLQIELNSGKRWDLLILHYLGLDHIGHVHGPYSSLIAAKLEEMDEIVGTIYSHLKQNEKGKSIIVICGDHGMANIGGHGGNTYPEVTTPLIILSTDYIRTCSNQKWKVGDLRIVDQIDVAPTLSTLWGLPFPSQSVGKVISDVLGHLSLKDQLLALHYNSVHLKKVLSKLSKSDDLQEIFKKYDRVTEEHISFLDTWFPGEELTLFENYKTLLSELSAACGAAVGEQNTLQLVGGIIIVFQALAMVYMPLSSENWLHETICIVVGVFCTAAASWTHFDPWVCLLGLIVFNFSLVFLRFDWKSLDLPEPESWIGWLLLTLHYFLPVIYFSSSFVEEEHSVRYYLWATVLILFILFHEGHEFGDMCVEVFIGLLAHRVAIAWNQTGQKWTHLNDFVDFLKGNEIVGVLIVLVSLAFLYYMRKGKVSPTFLASLIFVTVLKFDSSWADFVTFGYFKNFVKLGYIVPVLEGLSTLKARLPLRTAVTNGWILFTVLVQRLYNVPLVFLILVQVNVVSWLCEKSVQLHNRAVIFIWLSLSVFFYQGNSNSIASIDVNSGYLGLEEYNELLVGLLIYVNTFSTPVLVYLCYTDELVMDNQGRYYKTEIVTEILFETMARTNGLTVAIYSFVILTFRHHLFIWSVFTPKLLYLAAFTLLNFVVFAVYSLATTKIYPEAPRIQR